MPTPSQRLLAEATLAVNRLFHQFKTEVSDRAALIDPDNSQDWYSLTLGWALAKGLEIDVAHAFATTLRYNGLS